MVVQAFIYPPITSVLTLLRCSLKNPCLKQTSSNFGDLYTYPPEAPPPQNKEINENMQAKEKIKISPK